MFTPEEHRESVRTWLSQLVDLPTYREDGETDDEAFRSAISEGFDWLKGWAEQRNFECRNWSDRVFEIQAGSGPELGVATHLDVVPFNEEDWSVDEPSSLTVEDGVEPVFTGRGVIDDKGPITVMLLMMEYFREQGEFPVSLRLIVDSAEEVGLKNLRHYFEESEAELPERTLVADGFFPMVAGEKGLLRADVELSDLRREGEIQVTELRGGEAVNQVPGHASAILRTNSRDATEVSAQLGEKAQDLLAEVVVQHDDDDLVNVEVKGKTAHAATPDEGLNAISSLIVLLGTSNLEVDIGEGLGALAGSLAEANGRFLNDASGFGLEASDDRFEQGTTANLGKIAYRPGENLVLSLDFRLVPETRPTRAYEELQEWRPDGLDEDVTVQARHQVTEPALIVPVQDQLPQSALNAYRNVRGDDTEPVYIGGRTHATALENAFAFGCMEPERFEEYGFHGADERVPERELLEAAEIYVRTLKTYGTTRAKTG